MGLLDQMFAAPDSAPALGLLGAGLMAGNAPAGFQSAIGLLAGSKDRELERQLRGLQVQKGTLEMNLMQQQVDRQNAIRNDLAKLQMGGQPQQSPAPAAPTFNTPTIGGIPMFSMGTSVGQSPATAPAASAPASNGDGYNRQLSQRLVSQADIYARNGDFEGANKLYEQASKFLPEVKEMGVLMQGGKPVNVITYKDGTQRVTDLAPTPKTHFADVGGSIMPINEYTGQPLGPQLKKSPTPDALLTDSRERSQFKQTLAKDYTVAGFNPDGTPAGDMELTAKAIANGQLPPPSGMALTNPRNQRILARVMEINPSYDFTDVTAKRKAASDFTTGQLGNSMRSFAVAGQHLDQLSTLVDAMNNGNYPMVNKLANTIATQTGSVAPSNFDAAKDVVSKEVMKAIVAGGGGVGEREELQKTMDSAKTPAQLKGVITQYRNLMAAQHDALIQQRRAAGLPDSTIPNYTDANGSPSGSGEWKYIGTVK